MLDIGRKSRQGIDNYKNFVDNYDSVLEEKEKVNDFARNYCYEFLSFEINEASWKL